MGETGREGRTIIERVLRSALGLPDGLLEGVNVLPVSQDLLLLLGEGERVGEVVVGEEGVRVQGRHLDEIRG